MPERSMSTLSTESMWTDDKLVLASSNQGKLREFSKLFSDFGTTVIPQSDLHVESPEETGLSFIENALLKARHASAVTELPALADDSGLVIPASAPNNNTTIKIIKPISAPLMNKNIFPFRFIQI